MISEFDLDADGVRTLVESHPESLKVMASLLLGLNDSDITTRKGLDRELLIASKFRDIANDLESVEGLPEPLRNLITFTTTE